MPTVNYIGIFDCLCAVIFKMLQQVQINKTKHLLEWSLCTQFFISAFIFTVHLYARNFADIKLFMEAQYLKKHTEDSKVRGNINKLNFTVQKNAYCSKTEEELPFASILFFPYFAVKYNTIKSLLGEADEALKARAAAERMHPIKESFPRAFGKKTPDRTIKPPVENVSKETVCNMRPFSSQLLEKYIRFIIKNGTTERQTDVAKRFGLSDSALSKKWTKISGGARWPYRAMKALHRQTMNTIASINSCKDDNLISMEEKENQMRAIETLKSRAREFINSMQ